VIFRCLAAQVSSWPQTDLVSPRYVTGALSKICDNAEIPTTGVAAAAVKLGLLGSENIPKGVLQSLLMYLQRKLYPLEVSL
jgi:hypothetical protein